MKQACTKLDKLPDALEWADKGQCVTADTPLVTMPLRYHALEWADKGPHTTHDAIAFPLFKIVQHLGEKDGFEMCIAPSTMGAEGPNHKNISNPA